MTDTTRRVRFEIDADLPADITTEALETLLANATVQIAEPVIGYTDELGLNEITCASEVIAARVVSDALSPRTA